MVQLKREPKRKNWHTRQLDRVPCSQHETAKTAKNLASNSILDSRTKAAPPLGHRQYVGEVILRNHVGSIFREVLGGITDKVKKGPRPLTKGAHCEREELGRRKLGTLVLISGQLHEVGIGLELVFDSSSDNWRNGTIHRLSRDLTRTSRELVRDKVSAEFLHARENGGDSWVPNSDITEEQGHNTARDGRRGDTKINQTTCDKVLVLLRKCVRTLKNDSPGGVSKGIVSSGEDSIHLILHLSGLRRIQLGEEHGTCGLVILIKQNLRGGRVSTRIKTMV